MDKKELIIYDILNNYKFYVLQKNGFVNISKICSDFHVCFDDWHKEFFAPLQEAYGSFADIFSVKETSPLLIHENTIYLEISLAFHFIYWVSLKLGLGFCANIIPFLCEYFKE